MNLMKMTCHEGWPEFNCHSIIKIDTLPLTLAHPANTTLMSDHHRVIWLFPMYTALFITQTPDRLW